MRRRRRGGVGDSTRLSFDTLKRYAADKRIENRHKKSEREGKITVSHSPALAASQTTPDQSRDTWKSFQVGK